MLLEQSNSCFVDYTSDSQPSLSRGTLEFMVKFSRHTKGTDKIIASFNFY